MRVKSIVTTVVAISLMLSGAVPADAGRHSDYRQALDYYRNGFYERARALFESLPEDPLSEGYSVLCALKMRTEDAPALFEKYIHDYGNSSLTDMLHFERALMLFDEDHYEDASKEFAEVDFKAVSAEDRDAFLFKSGYCHYAQARYPEAMKCFEEVDEMPLNDFSAPSRYLAGLMQYNAKNFETAEQWFRKSVNDRRLGDISQFYIVDCEFNLKNYDFVIEEGEKIYEGVPQERKEHLARIISESYLVRGNKAKAREFYEGSYREQMSRSDYFYAGSVLYAVEDYKGAIENFLKMTDRTDSLGQIASYQMGNSYIRTRNKVAAMDAFKAASQVDFDSKITEDAFFNYAKLAFDLNKDTGGFADYIKRYFTKTKGEQIYSYIALAALYDRDYDRAVDAYDHIDELDDDMRQNYAKANYLRAEQLVGGGSFRDAIPYLRASAYYVDRNDRFNQLSRYWLAESNYRTGNYAEARKNFLELYNASALQGSPEGDLLPYNIAYSCFCQQDWDNAAKWFDIYSVSGQAVAMDDAVLRRADCDFARKDYKAAIVSYGNAIRSISDKSDIYPYYQQALSYGLAGDRKKKISVLSSIEEPDSPNTVYYECLYELGRTQMDLKKNTDASGTFNKLKELTKDNTYVAKALIGLGMVNRNSGNYDKALDYYKEVVSTMPGSEYAENALLAIESIYQKLKQPEKYVAYVESNSLASGKSEEEKDQMYFNTAEQLFLAGNYSQSIASLKKYLELYPSGMSSDKAVFYLAECYKASGEKEAACDMYAKAADGTSAGNSFSEVSRLNYAKLSYELERYADAYRGYATLLSSAKIEENRTTAQVGMMRSAYRGRDFSSAISTAEIVRNNGSSDAALRREALYVMAKSSLATSRREQAMAYFRELASEPSTPEGAESRYILIQDEYDSGNFDKVESSVYEFSDKAGDELYWLAKSYVLLGDAFVERGKISQAKATYESIRDGYSPVNGTSDDILENIQARLDRISSLK